MAGILSSLGNMLGAQGVSVNPYQISATQSNHPTTWASSTTTVSSVRLGKYITRDNLKHEAMLADVETLRNLWLARFSNEWVIVSDLEQEGDEFFWLAQHRLHANDALETINLMYENTLAVRIRG